MPHVALDVHLGLFPLGRGGQRDDAEDARADALGDRLDHSALAGPVAALEHDADFKAFVDGPQLQLHQFAVQARELALVIFVGELLLIAQTVIVIGLAAFAAALCRRHPFLPGSFFRRQTGLPIAFAYCQLLLGGCSSLQARFRLFRGDIRPRRNAITVSSACDGAGRCILSVFQAYWHTSQKP